MANVSIPSVGDIIERVMPCPICGRLPKVDMVWRNDGDLSIQIECDIFGSGHDVRTSYYPIERAIKEWNSRAEYMPGQPTATPVIQSVFKWPLLTYFLFGCLVSALIIMVIT